MAKHDSKSPVYSKRNRGWLGIPNFKSAVSVRWLGFILAITGVYVLSSANVSTQWIGWLITGTSCAIWAVIGWKDKDTPRMLMELVYLSLALRAILNWLQI